MPTTPLSLRISDAANYLKVSTKTLRRWENSGLIHPTRNPQNQRLYRVSELDQLKNRKHQPLPKKPSIARKPQYLTISEAADMLNVSIKTIRRWDKNGKIQSHRNPRNQRVFTHQAIQAAKIQHQRELYGISSIPHIPPSPINESNTYPQPAAFRSGFTIILLSLLPLAGLLLLRATPTPPADTLTLQETPLEINSSPTRIENNSTLTDTTSSPSPFTTTSLTSYAYDPELADIQAYAASKTHQIDTSMTAPLHFPESTTIPSSNSPIYPQQIDIPQEISPQSVTSDLAIDLEIAAPLTSDELNALIQEDFTTTNLSQLTDIGQNYQNQSTTPQPNTETLPLYSVYQQRIPFSQAHPNSPVLAIFTSPSGTQTVRHAITDPEQEAWLVRFIPDQLGNWQLRWFSSDFSAGDTLSFFVTRL